MVLRIGSEMAHLAQLSVAAQEGWWSEVLPDALQRIEGEGARRVGLWNCTWSSDWHYTLAYEFADLRALRGAIEILRSANFFRYVTSSRLMGERWVGELGWNADKWEVTQGRSPLGGVLYYKINESLYTLSIEELAHRSSERTALLDRAVTGLIDAGGQRLGSYFCEWSSEWHLFVVYDFADLEALKHFNNSLPDRLIPMRKNYVDYNVVLHIGTSLTELTDIRRP